MKENEISKIFAFMSMCCGMCQTKDKNPCCPFKECVARNENFEKLIKDNET